VKKREGVAGKEAHEEDDILSKDAKTLCYAKKTLCKAKENLLVLVALDRRTAYKL
jgi:hypothetical protein